MKEIEAIKQALAAYDAADCGRTEQRAILDIEDLASPSLFKTVLAHIEAQQREIERLRVDAALGKALRPNYDEAKKRDIEYIRWNVTDIDAAMKETP